jgi:hypothetical protein
MPRIGVIGAVVLASVAFFASGVSSAPARTSESDAWCALVIQIATSHGVMQNKRYVSQPTMRQAKRTVRAVLKSAPQLNTTVPKQIKSLQTDMLRYFARLVASRFSLTTPMAPFSAGEASQLVKFQVKRCGISGSWPIPLTGKKH